VVSADDEGRPNFSALQNDIKRKRYDRMVFYAFDLLYLDGFDTRAAPLVERKGVLQSLLSKVAATAPRILYSEHFQKGADLYARASAMGLEGIVSKGANAPYRSGRGGEWLKVKAWKRGRFAVIGFVPEGSGALLKSCGSRAARRAA
jgi:bifunctional non-homologous end joining protein LigD